MSVRLKDRKIPPPRFISELEPLQRRWDGSGACSRGGGIGPLGHWKTWNRKGCGGRGPARLFPPACVWLCSCAIKLGSSLRCSMPPLVSVTPRTYRVGPDWRSGSDSPHGASSNLGSLQSESGNRPIRTLALSFGLSLTAESTSLGEYAHHGCDFKSQHEQAGDGKLLNA